MTALLDLINSGSSMSLVVEDDAGRRTSARLVPLAVEAIDGGVAGP